MEDRIARILLWQDLVEISREFDIFVFGRRNVLKGYLRLEGAQRLLRSDLNSFAKGSFPEKFVFLFFRCRFFSKNHAPRNGGITEIRPKMLEDGERADSTTQ